MTKEEEHRLINALSDLSDKLDRMKKVNHSTPWGALGGWAAVILALITSIGGTVLNPLYSDMAENKKDIAKWSEQTTENTKEIAVIKARP